MRGVGLAPEDDLHELATTFYSQVLVMAYRFEGLSAIREFYLGNSSKIPTSASPKNVPIAALSRKNAFRRLGGAYGYSFRNLTFPKMFG